MSNPYGPPGGRPPGGGWGPPAPGQGWGQPQQQGQGYGQPAGQHPQHPHQGHHGQPQPGPAQPAGASPYGPTQPGGYGQQGGAPAYGPQGGPAYGPQGGAPAYGPQGAPAYGGPSPYAPAQAPQPYAPAYAGAAAPTALPDPDRKRRMIGLWLWILGVLAGVVLNILFTLLEIFSARSPDAALVATFIGAALAFPAVAVYLTVPTLLDRFDPEPWWCLAMAFAWGALVATGFAAMINTGVALVGSDLFGPKGGELLATVISAPLAEEFWKGLAVLGFFYFLRREFDGVVDGIIYATFCALGFAAVENVAYYARAAAHGQDVLVGTFVLRGIVAPWGHPLYTSMTGIGFGISRETSNSFLRWTAPIIGYFCGVFLHATWNFVPNLGGGVFALSLILWFLFVAAFACIVIALVVRKGRVIRDHLKDEVLIGNLTPDELALITSPVGRLKCTFSWRGAAGKKFIRAAARLALSKWHTARAMKGQKRTMSADFIVPYREELKKHRQEMLARAPR